METFYFYLSDFIYAFGAKMNKNHWGEKKISQNGSGDIAMKRYQFLYKCFLSEWTTATEEKK